MDIPVQPERNHYDLCPARVVDPATVAVPEEGTKIGIQSNGPASAFLPFSVEMVTGKCVVVVSPINQSRFRFARDGSWAWKDWDACPALLEPCPRCHGKTLIVNKKTGSEQSCPKCRGKGRVKRNDPLNA
jgi:hypothetical protein